MVVGSITNKGKSQAITIVDKNLIRVHKGLLNTVLAPEEKVALKAFRDMEMCTMISCSDADFGGNYVDETVFRILPTPFKTISKSSQDITEPGCRLVNAGACVTLLEDKGKIINGGTIINNEEDEGFIITSSFYDLCDQQDTGEETSIHQGFSNIGKILGIKKEKGTFLITEPNTPDDLEPGEVKNTRHTDAFKITTRMLQIENARHVNKTSRDFCSPYMKAALTGNSKTRMTMRDEGEDLEDTYNWKDFQKCEICKWFLDGPGDGNGIKKLFFDRCVSQKAIQRNLDAKFA
jgi:hypothetical protein